MTSSAYNGTSLHSDAFTKSVQLGEILGGVQFPCAAPAADQLIAQQSGK